MAESLKVIGRLHIIGQTQQIKDNFSKRTFVIEMVDESPNGQTYTNYAEFQLMNAQCAILDNFQAGQMVAVSFNIRGSIWNNNGVDKYITNLNAWKVELHGAMPQQQQQVATYTPPQQGYTSPQNNQSSVAGLNNPNPESQDLPF